MTDYRPIACDRHSEYELLAMHRRWVILEVEGPEGLQQRLHGQVMDVLTRDGAEYLQLKTDAGELLAIRLDRIRAVPVTD